jgi:hypothetical protein
MINLGHALAIVNGSGEVVNAVRLPAWALSPSGASSSERLVAVALCSLEAGGQPQSATWIAVKSGLSKRTVRRVLARLREDGRVLVRERFDVLSGRQLPSEYVLAE